MTRKPEEKQPDLASRLAKFRAALANVPRAFALLWEADPASAWLMGAVTLLGAGLPALQAWVTKFIVDGVVESYNRGIGPWDGLRAVMPYLMLEFLLILIGSVISQVRTLVIELIDHRLGHSINQRIMRKALSLEMRWFEDAEFYDKMQNARRQSEYRAMGLVNGGFLLAQNVLTLISFLALLLAFSPWIAGLLFAAAIPAFVIQSRYSEMLFRLQSWRTPETRAMNYLEQLLTLDSTVKEVKLFRLGETLLKRHSETFWKVFNEDAALARSRSVKSVFWGLLATLSYYAAYAWIIALTVGGKITLGSMTLYLTLFRQSQGTFQGMLENLAKLYENGLFLENLFGFLSLSSQASRLDPAGRPAEDPARGLELENVSFRYPGQERWIIENFSLEIAPNEKLALVGENGAGKTTLIKLLTRLYEPTRGRILFRGVDLRYFEPAELHRRIGSIFQDFVHYQLTLKENIGFGQIEKIEDPERVAKAAALSGADEIAAAFPERFEARLGRWFEDGHELSGGQWQKVALGRAFMSEGDVLVLDEPTASLDAAAEFEIFQRFRRLTEGKIAVLVSHRFSTVRMADRIAVLKAGRIEELGSHEELLARGGTYARLFELQAQGYR